MITYDAKVDTKEDTWLAKANGASFDRNNENVKKRKDQCLQSCFADQPPIISYGFWVS